LRGDLFEDLARYKFGKSLPAGRQGWEKTIGFVP